MQELRERARQLFATACRAADARLALSRALQDTPLPRPDAGGRFLVLAVGKAAVPMAECLLSQLKGQAVEAILVTNPENARAVEGAQVFAAAHPVPDDNGARAAQAVEALLATARASDRVIALVSGGASALLPAPVAGVPLADKITTNQLLLAGGFEIGEINLVRQSLSRLKGGGLLRAAGQAPVCAYILSDVIGDDLRVIGSGLTVAPIATRAQACALLRSRGTWPKLPQSVQSALQRPELEAPLPVARNVLIGSNRKSLEAVLEDFGEGAVIINDHLTGDVGDAAQIILQAAQESRAHRCLIFGGETTVTLKGQGLGGRNQELALRVALAMPRLSRQWVFLSGGTDGRDGPTLAAGGIVDEGTAGRIAARGGDGAALLANNDSHRALALADDLLITGATGTNVADVQILLFA